MAQLGHIGCSYATLPTSLDITPETTMIDAWRRSHIVVTTICATSELASLSSGVQFRRAHKANTQQYKLLTYLVLSYTTLGTM